MLIDEERLRELYAAGEIDLPQLERSLDIINRRREANNRRAPSAWASRPLTHDEKRAMMAEADAMRVPQPRTPPPPPPKCPRCRNNLRKVVEYGVHTAWCVSCQAYAGPDPRDLLDEPQQSGTTWVGGVIFPLDGGMFG
jgi:hypothetical protein